MNRRGKNGLAARSGWGRVLAVQAVLLLVPFLAAAAGSQEAAGETTRGALVNTGKPVTFMVSEHSSITYNENSAVVKELARRTGVEFEVLAIPSSDFNVKRKAILAANDLPDILAIGFDDVQTYADDGLFVNLSERDASLPGYFTLVKAAYDAMKFFKIEGSFYHFARTAKANPAYLSGPMIRADKVAAVGMKVPQSFDELYTVLKAFKQADPSCVPWATRGDTFVGTMGYSFGTGSGVYFDEAVGGGSYLFAPIHSSFGDLLAYLNRLYTERLIDPDYAVATSAQWQEKLSSGKSYFFYDNTTFSTNFNKVLAKDNPAARFIPMTTLKNRYGQQRSQYFPGIGPNSPTRDGWVVSSRSANAGGALILMDYMYSDAGSELTSWGIENEHFAVVDGKRIVKKEMIEKYSKMGDPWRAYQADIGTGTLSICPYFDNYSMFAFLPEDQIQMYEFWSNDKHTTNFQYLPTLNAAESERLVQINSKLNTMLATEVSKFVMGLRPLNEFGQFVKALVDAGADEVERMYAAAYARIK